MEGYNIIESLGDGSYGTVNKATNNKTGEVCAIKTMKAKFDNWNECLELREVKSLRKLKHPNIIKLKEAQLIKNELFMVFEFCDQNLYQYYGKYKDRNQQIPETQICRMIYQITSSLAYMHKNGFFHRDMKPENILLLNDQIKLCDFGLAREIRSRPPFTEYVSTRWYRSPEIVLKATNYNSPSDIFALGCIMAELYMLAPLFAGQSSMDQIMKVIKVMGTPSQQEWPEGYQQASKIGFSWPQFPKKSLASIIPNASPEALSFIEVQNLCQSTLLYDPAKRPTANQLLQHPYFEKFNNQVKADLPDLRLKSRESQRLKLRSRENNQKKNELYKKEEKLPNLNVQSYEKQYPQYENKKLPVVNSNNQQPFSYKYGNERNEQKFSYKEQDNLYNFNNNFNKNNDYLKEYNRNNDNKSNYSNNYNNYNAEFSKDNYQNYQPSYKDIYDFKKPNNDLGRVSPYLQQVKKKLSPVLYNQIKPTQINNIKKLDYNFNSVPKHYSQRQEPENPYLQGLKLDKISERPVLSNGRNQQMLHKYGKPQNFDARSNKQAVLSNLYKF